SRIFGRDIVLTEVIQLNPPASPVDYANGDHRAKQAKSLLDRDDISSLEGKSLGAVEAAFRHVAKITFGFLASQNPKTLREGKLGFGSKCITAIQAMLRAEGLHMGMTPEELARYSLPIAELKFTGKHEAEVEQFLAYQRSKGVTTVGQLVNRPQRDVYLE